MRRLAPWLLLPFLGAGCETEQDVQTCASAQAPRQAYVVSALRFARRDAGVVDGFDLDGTDEEICGHTDLVAPSGQTGIDNNFSALVPILEATEASATESLISQSISSGELLLTIELADVDSWIGDDCVDFTLGRAEGVPLVGPDGGILDSQTLARSTTVASASAVSTSDDRQITTGELAFNLPLDILNAELDFQVTQGRFRVQKRHDGAITGIMAGRIPIGQITEILLRDDVGLDGFVPIVESTADLPGENGACEGLSLAFEFEAIPVWLVDAG